MVRNLRFSPTDFKRTSTIQTLETLPTQTCMKRRLFNLSNDETESKAKIETLPKPILKNHLKLKITKPKPLRYHCKQLNKMIIFKTYREDDIFVNLENVQKGNFEKPDTPENDFDCTSDPELINQTERTL